MPKLVALSFASPAALWLILLLPLLAACYLKLQRQKWQDAARFSYAALVEHLQLRPQPWKRLFAPCVLLALAFIMIVGAARPVAVTSIPQRVLDMMLVIDVSASMSAEDLKPSRIEAARDAAIKFVESLPKHVRVGLQLFAGGTRLMNQPTAEHQKVIASLRTLSQESLEQYTEIGGAIEATLPLLKVKKEEAADKSGETPRRVIVLMGDGDQSGGPSWETASARAKAENVVVHTVAIGTTEEVTMRWHGIVKHERSYSEETLQGIASISGGKFYRVFGQGDFKEAYGNITQEVELSHHCASLALLLLLPSALIYGVWIRRF
jgi:Ca-activated chloride channel homolog